MFVRLIYYAPVTRFLPPDFFGGKPRCRCQGRGSPAQLGQETIWSYLLCYVSVDKVRTGELVTLALAVANEHQQASQVGQVHERFVRPAVIVK